MKVKIDGVLYFKIMDAYKASYSVNNPVNAIALLAQTSMRSEIGRLILDRTFEERESLNSNIKFSLNKASEKWGIDCMRYEIKDIKPPDQIKRSMELQAESERSKRSSILQSEGESRTKINIAEGNKRESILRGEGDATKILQEAKSMCESLNSISGAINNSMKGGAHESEALNLRLTEQYLDAMGEIMGKSTILMTPPNQNGGTQSVAEILTMYKHIVGGNSMSSAKMAKAMQAGNTDPALRQILQDLEKLKHS